MDGEYTSGVSRDEKDLQVGHIHEIGRRIWYASKILAHCSTRK